MRSPRNQLQRKSPTFDISGELDKTRKKVTFSLPSPSSVLKFADVNTAREGTWKKTECQSDFKRQFNLISGSFSFRLVNKILAGKAKRKDSLMQIFFETSTAHFFWLIDFYRNSQSELLPFRDTHELSRVLWLWKSSRKPFHLSPLTAHFFVRVYFFQSILVFT